MNPVIPNATSIPEMVSRLAGTEVSALALVGTVSEGEHASVVAFIVPGTMSSASFRHSIEMESDYSDALLGFEDSPPPYYGDCAVHVDLAAAAGVIGVDRVICLVMQIGADQISVVRDYDDLEVTLIYATKMQFDRFIEVLDGTPAIDRKSVQ